MYKWCKKEENFETLPYLTTLAQIAADVFLFHCLFANVFFNPLNIIANHIQFMTDNTNGTTKTKSCPKACIWRTCMIKGNALTQTSEHEFFPLFFSTKLNKYINFFKKSLKINYGHNILTTLI